MTGIKAEPRESAGRDDVSRAGGNEAGSWVRGFDAILMAQGGSKRISIPD